ncbi:unnamed protein product [Pleuronectes platessa]|uniref:Uncharacterized protein n=1 Tax=Pleuronectes platessa TaxID=8262 RepID=A0A9N7U2W8_PLEPL|nr:unnamed protein product [Pleuronectes platessa]
MDCGLWIRGRGVGSSVADSESCGLIVVLVLYIPGDDPALQAHLHQSTPGFICPGCAASHRQSHGALSRPDYHHPEDLTELSAVSSTTTLKISRSSQRSHGALSGLVYHHPEDLTEFSAVLSTTTLKISRSSQRSCLPPR